MFKINWMVQWRQTYFIIDFNKNLFQKVKVSVITHLTKSNETANCLVGKVGEVWQ